MTKAGLYCYNCNRLIPDGEPMWSVNVHREAFSDGMFTVYNADCYKVYCDACGRRYDFSNIHIPFKNQ